MEAVSIFAATKAKRKIKNKQKAWKYIQELCSLSEGDSEKLAIIDGKDVNPDNYKLMSYDHLAGELALHMIIADITNDLGANKGNSFLKKFFDMSVVSDLNVDEDRLAPAIIATFGNFVRLILTIFA